MIDARLSGHILPKHHADFLRARRNSPGEVFTASELTTYLQKVGYRPEADDAALGQYTANGSGGHPAFEAFLFAAAML